MQHGIVTARVKRKVTDYGGDSKLIGAEHKPHSYDNKPAESGFAGKTGFKNSYVSQASGNVPSNDSKNIKIFASTLLHNTSFSQILANVSYNLFTTTT